MQDGKVNVPAQRKEVQSTALLILAQCSLLVCLVSEFSSPSQTVSTLSSHLKHLFVLVV